MPDLGSLDVRRKPCPEGNYRGKIMDISWKTKEIDGEEVTKANVRINILTDNPNVDESTIGKQVFDSLPWTEKMAWKFGAIYAAVFGLDQNDDALSDMTPEKFEEIKNNEVIFNVVHAEITTEDGRIIPMTNVRDYKHVDIAE